MRVTKRKARQSVKAWYKYYYHGVKRNIPMAFLSLRDVELNTKLQASFWRYNSAIPSYLRERPHHIIKHSMDRLSLAESIPSSNVTVIDMENGEFLVKSQSSLEEKKMYKVMFGTKQPSCECFDWERQRLPCKHFFAVFQHVPSWSFDRLPKEYRDSPFFSVDRDLLLAGEKEEGDSIADEKVVDSPPCVHDEVHDLQMQSSQFENIPQLTSRPWTHAAKCRELLGQIKKRDLHCGGVGSWWEFKASSGKAWRVSRPSAENSPQGERYHSGSSSPEVYYEKEFAQDEKKESRL